MLDLTLQNSIHDRSVTERFVRTVLTAVLTQAGFARHTAEVGVLIVGSRRMRELNRRTRGKNVPTNVLSLPLMTTRELVRARRKPSRLVLGDIILCSLIARTEARAAGETLRYRLAWLLAHGMLHLVGHDHERPAAARRRGRA